MYHLDDIKTITPGGRPLSAIVTDYIREKNLNFIVARGQCRNLRQADLAPGDLETCMSEFSACGFSRVSCPDLRPCPPFLAADLDGATKSARVVFLIDLTAEAETGRASKFYSKILGALSSQFFAACPGISRLFFPFALEETAAGRGLSVEEAEGGTWVIKD
jgi:hypothetical protein